MEENIQYFGSYARQPHNPEIVSAVTASELVENLSNEFHTLHSIYVVLCGKISQSLLTQA